jgi:hypothetical protein
MRFSRSLNFGVTLSVVLTIGGFVPASFSAPAKAAASPAATNSAPAELVIPPAIFDLSTPGIKDPFFPATTRTALPVATNTASFSAGSFLLKALSGSANQRLALINNRTLARGEEAEVTVATGQKIKIVCLDIREASVLIRAPGQLEPLELHLRKGVQ